MGEVHDIDSGRQASTAPPETPAPRRGRFGVFLVLAVLAGGGVWAWLSWRGQQGVSTDDAFIRADLIQVPAEVGGRVARVLVVENQHVGAGDTLIEIDRTELGLRVTQAEANLAGALADLRRTEDAVAVARSDAKTGELRGADAERELRLQTELAVGGAAGRVAEDRATTQAKIASQAVETASRGVVAAEAAVEAARARIPAAQAALDLARRELDLAQIRAPEAGVVSKLDLQAGELVQRGQPVLAIVPDHRFVVANFKETDLGRIQVGAPVDIVLDAFPGREMRGKVESVAAGTGAVFSLLPADNATGNFIKVVQRVPVRVRLDEEDARVPAGLSALVTVEPVP